MCSTRWGKQCRSPKPWKKKSARHAPGTPAAPATPVGPGRSCPRRNNGGWNCSMGPFWGSFFEQFKGCGRERGFAAFFAAVGVIIVVFLVGLAIGASQLDRYMGSILVVFG